MERSILVVDDNREHGDLVAGAIASLCLVRPARAATSDDAVRWITTNPCDVCVLDWDLPRVDGIETMLRMHQRRPDLPVIIVSSAKSEQVAIAAFQAGVTDYVPKGKGFQTVAAHAVQKVLLRHERIPLTNEVTPAFLSPNIPPELLRPTYQNRLRAIGRQFDDVGLVSFNIVEVTGGFIVRAQQAGSRGVEALEFPDAHLPHLVAAKIGGRGRGDRPHAASALLPTGNEDFLRALGYRLDHVAAEMVTIIELTNYVVVGGTRQTNGRLGGPLVPFEWFLRTAEIETLLNEAYQRRGGQQQKKALFSRLAG